MEQIRMERDMEIGARMEHRRMKCIIEFLLKNGKKNSNYFLKNGTWN